MVKDILLGRNLLGLLARLSKWHMDYFLTGKPAPLACGFYITTKCNFRCEFCNIWRIAPGYQVGYEEARKFIAELGNMKLAYFSVSGGEPLLVPYVFDLLFYAKQRGILYTHIVSNGYLLDKYRAKEMALARLSEVSFSLDGNKEVHDTNRGMQGAFDRVIVAVDLVRTNAPKVKIVLNTILDSLNPQNALFAVNTARRLKVKIKVQPENDHPDFKSETTAVKRQRYLEPRQKKALFDAIKVMQKSRHVANSKPFLENYKTFLNPAQDLPLSKSDCIFGFHHLEFFAGKIFPCLEGSFWQGGFDITSSAIKDVISSSQYRDKLQQLKKCDGCENNYYVCYYEPRLNFPIWNFVSSRMRRNLTSEVSGIGNT